MKKIFLLMIAIQLGIVDIDAIDGKIELKESKGSGAYQIEIPIPVHADIYNSVLGIHFKKAKQVFVLVSGPDGVVYQREVTSETEKSIYVDLAQYQEGEYTIYFQDAEGNEVSGDFLNEKE